MSEVFTAGAGFYDGNVIHKSNNQNPLPRPAVEIIGAADRDSGARRVLMQVQDEQDFRPLRRLTEPRKPLNSNLKTK